LHIFIHSSPVIMPALIFLVSKPSIQAAQPGIKAAE